MRVTDARKDSKICIQSWNGKPSFYVTFSRYAHVTQSRLRMIPETICSAEREKNASFYFVHRRTENVCDNIVRGRDGDFLEVGRNVFYGAYIFCIIS